MVPDIELYLQPDGFWCGRRLKNGKMSKHSHCISEEEIATMFSTFMNAYCAETGQDKLLLKDAIGQGFLAVKLKTESGETQSV